MDDESDWDCPAVLATPLPLDRATSWEIRYTSGVTAVGLHFGEHSVSDELSLCWHRSGSFYEEGDEVAMISYAPGFEEESNRNWFAVDTLRLCFDPTLRRLRFCKNGTRVADIQLRAERLTNLPVRPAVDFDRDVELHSVATIEQVGPGTERE